MSSFPDELKTWRKSRRFSQLALATEADVSLRHISFLETGRAKPSADMVGRLGDAMQLPLSARNHMLMAAGYAARYSGRAWDELEMAPLRTAIDHTLKNHAPYPAIALDDDWRLVRLNEPAEKLFAMLGTAEGMSLLDVVMQPTMSETIENWPEVARHTALRLRTESNAQGGRADLDRVAEYLEAVEGETSDTAAPVVPTIYRAGNIRLSLFATIAQFGTPEDVTLDNLKIELFFPSDEATDAFLKAM